MSISDENYNSYGTLGGLVWDRISGVEIILSNWRVLVTDWNARDHRSVEMSSHEGGAAAIAQFNGREINGRRLIVNEEKPPMTRAAGASFGGNWSWKRIATLWAVRFARIKIEDRRAALLWTLGLFSFFEVNHGTYNRLLTRFSKEFA